MSGFVYLPHICLPPSILPALCSRQHRNSKPATQLGPSRTSIYLLPGFNALVGKVGEGRAGNEAAHAGDDVHVPIFQNDLPLADDHLWGAAQLHALKDVVLSSLKAHV